MSEPEASPAGPVGSLRRMTDSLLALVDTRLQLFAVELQCEKLRLMEQLLWLGLAVAIGLVGLLLAVAALAIYLWQISKFAGLIALGIVFLAAAGIMLWRLRAGIRNSPIPLADTLAEFKKDRACFAGEELRKLEESKRFLVAQADLHRNLIRMEFTAWGARLKWLRPGRFAMGRPYLLIAALLTGVGASAVKWRTLLRWVPRFFAAWRLARGLFRT